MTQTNHAFFFHKKRAGHCQRKRRKETTGAAKKPCTQSIMQKYLQQRETVGEQQQMKRKKKNNKKILRTVEERVGMISVWCVGRRKRIMWTLKTGWHVKCVHVHTLQSSILYITCRLSLPYLFTVAIFIEY